MIVSRVQQGDSVLYIYVYRYTCIPILFQILFHSRLSQDVDFSSLYYIVGACDLLVLYELCFSSLLLDLCLGTGGSVLSGDSGVWVPRSARMADPIPASGTTTHPVAPARNPEALWETFGSHTSDICSNIRFFQGTPELCLWPPAWARSSLVSPGLWH